MAEFYYDQHKAVVVSNEVIAAPSLVHGPEKPVTFSPGTYKDFDFSIGAVTYYPKGVKWIAGESVKPGDLSVRISANGESITVYKSNAPSFVSTIGSTTINMLGTHANAFAGEAPKRTVYGKGDMIQSKLVRPDTYPVNGRHTDGFWYVRKGEANKAPTLTLDTTNNRTLYENDTFGVSGTVTDSDAGDVVSVKFSINNYRTVALTTFISTGASTPYSDTLNYKNNRIWQTSLGVSEELKENTNYTLRVWAEDDKGGKSPIATRTFQVVANRAPIVTVNPLVATVNQINTDKVTVSGSVNDPDGNSVKVSYKVGNASFAEIYDGQSGSFTFDVPLNKLSNGSNSVVIRAVDSYGATTTKNLNLAKSESLKPLNESVKRYKINPPNGEAQGIILWVERDVGDIVVSAEASMTDAAEDELFVPMTLNSTAFVSSNREEDEFEHDALTSKKKIIVKITMVRASTSSSQGIRLVSGVLS